ncbi:MAG: polysaccharide pyruvyl transferase family protein [Gammaproteobacteria bacterium]|nr:polysaccharide pyruvyl transferase family protein [Gammaproteobacteria bacterium]
MILEIHGAQFRNKGALKMLHVAISKIRSHEAQMEFALDEAAGNTAQIRSMGLSVLKGSRGWMGSRWFSPRFKIQKILNHVPFGSDRLAIRNVDGLIDVSGFAFSDVWGHRPMRDFNALASYYAEQGKPVIMLPQALGPFRSHVSRQNFVRLMDSVSAAYARDRTSYNYAAELIGECSKLRIAPDITLFDGRQVPPVLRETKISTDVFIVPNIQVTRRGDAWSVDVYVEMMADLIRLVLSQNCKPRLLVHDTSGADRVLAHMIIGRVKESQVELVEEEDPWKLKVMIGASRAVIGSRYHALVAALSSCVPVVSIGWSHKYDELLSDFGQVGFCIDRSSERIDVENAVRRVCDEKEHVDHREILMNKLSKLGVRNEQMWREILSLVRGGEVS